MSSDSMKNTQQQHQKDNETLPFISMTPPSPLNSIYKINDSTSSSSNNINLNNSSGGGSENVDYNHLYSPEDLQPRKIPQEHHFRIDSKTRNLHHQSRVYSPLVPPVFREVSSWSSFIIQAMFGLVSVWLIVDWILPRLLENSKTKIFLKQTEEEYTKSLLRNIFELIIIFHVTIDSVVNCLIPTLLRFTLAEHTFKNLKSNIVNTNQFLNFQYPRAILRIFLRPFWIFYSLLVFNVTDSGISIRMLVFLFASVVGFYDVQQFSQSVLYLQYKMDDVSKFIYVDVEYKENFKESMSPYKTVTTVILIAVLPLFLIVQVLHFLSLKNILIFGFSCIIFIGVDNVKYWPEAIRYNIRYLLYGISQIGLIWTMHQQLD